MYLIDTNIVIGAFNHRPRDIFETYWRQFDAFFSEGQFYFHQSVENELLKRDDEKSQWLRSFVPTSQILTVTQEEVDSYRAVTRWVRDRKDAPYEESAIREFLRVADSWIVASAHARDFIVITNETPSPRKRTRVKLPDVANGLGVQCMTEFDFLRQQSIIF